jgi:hypothetical protein
MNEQNQDCPSLGSPKSRTQERIYLTAVIYAGDEARKFGEEGNDMRTIMRVHYVGHCYRQWGLHSTSFTKMPTQEFHSF